MGLYFNKTRGGLSIDAGSTSFVLMPRQWTPIPKQYEGNERLIHYLSTGDVVRSPIVEDEPEPKKEAPEEPAAVVEAAAPAVAEEAAPVTPEAAEDRSSQEGSLTPSEPVAGFAGSVQPAEEGSSPDVSASGFTPSRRRRS
jgi:hypothetical protein